MKECRLAFDKCFTCRFNTAAVFLFLAAFIGTTAMAECIPSEDPCAPKKVAGEWDTNLAFGLNFTQGNTETTAVSFLGAAALDYEQNIWDLSLSYLLGEDKAVDDPENGNTTKNEVRSKVSYKRLLTERLYIGIGSGFLYDEIADIDYRATVLPTAGYYLLRDNSFKFALELSPAYLFEKVGGFEDDYFAPRVADEFAWMITCTSKLFQKTEMFYDINDSDNYLINGEIGVEAALNSSLSLVLLTRGTYDNQPAAGREKDDLIVLTALKVAL